MSQEKKRVIVIQIAFFMVLFATWFIATESETVSHLFLPSLDSVYREFINILVTGEAFKHLKVTLTELSIAFSNAAFFGMTIGFFISRSPFLMRTFEPLFSSLFAIPLIIFYPLALLFFGLGVESKIAIGSTLGFFPIVLNTINGFGHVDPIYTRAAHSMGASKFLLFRRVLLPAALPIILTGVRIGFILTFLSIIGGETLGSLEGLGHQIVFYAEAMSTDKMFAYIIFVIAIAVVLNSLVFYIERKGSYT